MKLKNYWKRFWTLDRHHAEGFTLVELIVVIAILAILAGVGIPVYSGYITKANKQADMTLASEVAQALTLAYYNQKLPEGGFVVLTKDGVDTTNMSEDVKAALIATFGADSNGIPSIAGLKYDGWTTDGLMQIVSEYTKEELNTISNSTFLKESTPESLMATVTNMTGLVSNVIKDSNLSVAADRLTSLLGDGNSVSTTLDNLEIDADDPEYSTVVSNLLVGYMADNMENAEEDNNLVGIMNLYAGAYGYAAATGDDSVLDLMNTNLEKITFNQLNSDEWFDYVTSGVSDLPQASTQAYDKFLTNNLETNEAALRAMMDGVSHIAGKYTDKESLSNAELYSSDDVASQVNNYVNAIKAQAGMSEEERAGLTDGEVLVHIDANGITKVTPGEVLQ